MIKCGNVTVKYQRNAVYLICMCNGRIDNNKKKQGLAQHTHPVR